MAKGKVKWYDSTKGFGFIQPDSGEDLFVHYTGIVTNGYEKAQLLTDQRVKFEVVEGRRGLQAVNVEVLED